MTKATKPLILIVDDEPAVREMERRILEKGGYLVKEASSAAEAFALITDGMPVDLLIADLDMPVVSGEQMVTGIHKVTPHLKVLYVTGNIDRLLDARSLVWAGEAFLDKPFTNAGLLEAVSLLLTNTLSGGVK